MPYQPSGRIDRLAGILIPPASAEHVLGDAAECSDTRRQYVWTLLAVLPHVVWSQIRRRVTIGGLIFSGILNAIVFIPSQQVFHRGSIDQPAVWFSLLAVWAIWVTGCALSSAYGPADKPLCGNGRLFAATIIVVIGLAAVLPLHLIGIGAAMACVWGVSVLLTMPFERSPLPPPLSLETLPQHARLFQKSIWWRNLREALGALVVIALNVPKVMAAPAPLAVTGYLLLIAAALFIVYFLYVHAGSRRVPDNATSGDMLRFHRAEIVRQRNVLRAVPVWYLMPFLPGLILIFATKSADRPVAMAVALMLVAAIFTFVWRLNVLAARFLDKQLTDVEALDSHV